MTLFPFQTFYAHQRDPGQAWDAAHLRAFTLATNGNQPVGRISDVLVDDGGHFRYLVIDIGSTAAAAADKSVLLPIGLAQFDYDQKQVFVKDLSGPRLQQLPPYDPGTPVDRRYEQRVRDVLRPIASRRMGRSFLQQPYTLRGQYRGTSSGHTPSADQDYNRHPDFYGLSDFDNQRPLKVLENQLEHQRTQEPS